MKTNKPSRLFTFGLTFFKNHVLLALAGIAGLYALYDEIAGRFFKDEPNLVAKSSIQYMEIGPPALNKYREIKDKFEPEEIVKTLETWNKQPDREKSVIPDKASLEAFREYAEYRLPEEDAIRSYARIARYNILMENTGTKTAEDIFIISTMSAKSAVVERATGAGFGFPKYEIIEHDGKRASLGNLFPSEKMEINIWYDSYFIPNYVSITSADGQVDIQQEVKIGSRKEVVTVWIIMGITILIVNWLFREFFNFVTSLIRKEWKKHNTHDEDGESDVEATTTSEHQ